MSAQKRLDLDSDRCFLGGRRHPEKHLLQICKKCRGMVHSLVDDPDDVGVDAVDGPIPDDLDVDHVCFNTACIRLDSVSPKLERAEQRFMAHWWA